MDIRLKEVLTNLKNYDFCILGNYKMDKNEAQKLIDALEDIEKGGWISCSERLPKEYVDVLVCTDANEIFIANYLGKMNDGEDCFDDDNGMMWEGNVIKWQPLPTEFEESEG